MAADDAAIPNGAVGFKKSPLSGARTKPWHSCDLQRTPSARIPVLVIVAKHESVYNGPKMAARLRRQLPYARIELVDNAKHMVMVDQLEIVGSCSPTSCGDIGNCRAKPRWALDPEFTTGVV